MADISQKLRGGYYTPQDVADALTQWALARNPRSVLEPSFGDGVFLHSIVDFQKKQHTYIPTFGIEINEDEFSKVRPRFENSFLFCQDFFEWYSTFNSTLYFDAVLGNPPFIRYQNFPEASRFLALKHSENAGIKLNKLTNMWVPFVILSVEMLKPGGRLGMVVPAELLQVSYAKKVREYLMKKFDSITVITCNNLIFDEAEQEVVILLADGKQIEEHTSCKFQLVETHTRKDLLKAIQNPPVNSFIQAIPGGKWTFYLLREEEIEAYLKFKSDSRIARFGDYYAVDVGIVTGNNDFFVVDKQTATDYSLSDHIRPIVGRSVQIPETQFTTQDWKELWNSGKKVGLLDLNEFTDILEKPAGVMRYLNAGMETGVHKGYKCAIRKRWYAVPSIWVPDAFMFRQIHDFPHFVKNSAGAVSTDTIHRVRKKNSAELPTEMFYTFLTAISAEIEGRSYGGGVLELEPSEAEKLLIPRLEYVKSSYLMPVDRRENIETLRRNTQSVLIEGLGFSRKETDLLESAYLRLFNRRRSRS
ncbi:MAG: class I SAM-dependent methyltransferase [Thermoguttaceae bacterium]|nr:class I SAM-dependent methyltransferase [Thermoguttaceae bacterium]